MPRLSLTCQIGCHNPGNKTRGFQFVSYLFCSFGAALRARWPGAVSGSRGSLCLLQVDIFGHVDIIVQQHLLPRPSGGATGGRGGGLSVAKLRKLLQAPTAAAPALGLQAAARLDAATAAVGGQEG